MTKNETSPPQFSMRGIADAVELLRAGRVDRIALLRDQISKRETRRSADDVERMARPIPVLERAALVFNVLAENRSELPVWIVDLIENGRAP